MLPRPSIVRSIVALAALATPLLSATGASTVACSPTTNNECPAYACHLSSCPPGTTEYGPGKRSCGSDYFCCVLDDGAAPESSDAGVE